MPVRVLQVLMCDGVGGTEAMVSTLVEQLDPADVTSEVVTLSGHGPVAARLIASGVRVRSLGRGNGVPVATRRLVEVIRREGFDVVNAYGFKATTAARFPARAFGARFVCGVRGLHITEAERVDSPKARFALAVERLESGLVDVYDANSLGALDLLVGVGVPRRKLRYIPNGLDLADWPAATLEDVAEPIITCIARFVPRKRQIDLVRAAELLQARDLAFRLVFYGDGPTLDETRVTAAAGPAADRIEFRGPVAPAGVAAALRGADVACLPTMWEGMANTVMEAMACGLPVVGTDVNGVADLIVDGETGALVAPEQPAALAAALEPFLRDVGLRRRMGAAGRRRVAERFTVQAMVRDKAALYRELHEVA
jgi:glycosyltransferase involved in cell wall biosynthesis